MNLNSWLKVMSSCCTIVLLVSFLLEYVLHLTPCVLCQLQRVIVGLMLCLVLLQVIKQSNFWAFYLSFFVVNISGLALALRHVWLQSQPLVDSAPLQCLPPLEVLVNWLPWHQVIVNLVKGDAMCQSVAATFMGLSLAMWLVVVHALMISLWLYIWLSVASKTKN